MNAREGALLTGWGADADPAHGSTFTGSLMFMKINLALSSSGIH
jgi:hypothetical protein